MAVWITAHAIGSLRGMSDEEACDRVRMAIRAANDAIFKRTVSEGDKRGMGTTATVLALLKGRYVVGHVGDSRAYLLRDGRLLQLTKDHSYVQELVDAGLITGPGPGPSVQRHHHPLRRRDPKVVPDIHVGSLEQGDILLLASDGLTGMLEDEQLIRILSSDGEPQHWVDRMITEANRRGGRDNITAIVVSTDAARPTHSGAIAPARRKTAPFA